jgi:O-antigen ligase
MCMKNVAWLVILTILLVFPYQFFGEEAGTHFFLSSLMLYFMAKKRITINDSNKGYIFLLLSLMLYAAVAAFISVNPIRSLYGVSLYACMLLAFLLANEFQEEAFMKYFVYLSSILAAIASFYQGFFLEQMRIYGNLGYANTYALILLISFILSDIYKNIKGQFYIKIILVIAVMLTGDRVAIILLGAWSVYYTITERKLNSFVGLLSGIICYAFFSTIGAAAVVIAPPIIWLLNEVDKRAVKWNSKMVFWIAWILLGGIVACFHTNTFERIKNISWNNPSLLERLISFEDVLKQTPDALFGRGANSYEYSQYLYKSAFYESKYIHNIFLQNLYDFGVIGALLFLAFVLYGGYTIAVSSHKYKKGLLAIYIAVMIHGMWNFDIVFPIVFVFISIIVAFCSGTREIVVMNRLVRPLALVVFLFFILLAVHEGTIRVADMSIRKEKPLMAQTLITLQRHMNIPDERVYFIQAAVEKWKYDQSHQLSFLHLAKENLEKAQTLNEVDPRIKWNLAYILTENKEFAKAEKLWNEVLKREGKNKEAYKMYVQFLNKAYARDKEEKNKKIEELKKIHDMNRKSLHPKAQFLSNQLQNTLESTLVK